MTLIVKTLILSLILLSAVNLAYARTKEKCINIIESNLNKVVTNIVEIKEYDDKIIVISERDNKKYRLSILKNATEFSKQIKVGGRISIQCKEGIRYIYVARMEERGIMVKIFNICD